MGHSFIPLVRGMYRIEIIYPQVMFEFRRIILGICTRYQQPWQTHPPWHTINANDLKYISIHCHLWIHIAILLHKIDMHVDFPCMMCACMEARSMLKRLTCRWIAFSIQSAHFPRNARVGNQQGGWVNRTGGRGSEFNSNRHREPILPTSLSHYSQWQKTWCEETLCRHDHLAK